MDVDTSIFSLVQKYLKLVCKPLTVSAPAPAAVLPQQKYPTPRLGVVGRNPDRASLIPT